MDKILVTLIVPNLNEKYCVLIPDFLMIKSLRVLLAEALEEITHHQYVSSSTEVLCRKDPYEILDLNYTLKDYDICHGDSLILF